MAIDSPSACEHNTLSALALCGGAHLARRDLVQGREASSIHIGFGWPVADLLTLPFSSVAMRLGPVLAGPVPSCVGAAGRFAAVCCVGVVYTALCLTCNG